MADTTITLKQFLEKNKTFVVPEYQRGYIWGKKHTDGGPDSVTFILNDILKRFEVGSDMFLQGITVTERDNEIVLIDGQQRTTFLYLLLKKTLNYQGNFVIKYEVRKESNDYLNGRLDGNNDFQDIFFFNKTLEIIKNKISNVDQNKLQKFILDKIIFLYINIPEDQAINVFTMMNGNRAKMRQEELIKAELLRISSLNTSTNNGSEEFYAKEWEDNELRSRFAREWDRWLRWWNQGDVVKLFNTENSYMGLLLTTFYDSKNSTNTTFSFEAFKNVCLNESTPQQAKKIFLELRQLQKHFEDVYNKSVMYNQVGAILRIINNKDDIKKFIRYIFVEGGKNKLDNYYKLSFLGMTHEEITGDNKEKFKGKYDNTLNLLNEDLLYQRNTEFAFRFLLRLNIDEDNKLERKFDFDIWSNRSLEHIYPKSKVWHWNADKTMRLISQDSNENNDKEVTIEKTEEQDVIWREEINDGNGNVSTEHGLGNLVLLYKNENASFNAGSFSEKKKKFFDPLEKDFLKSRNLLHTICVFAKYMDWTGESIVKNKLKIIRKFEEDYKKLREDFKYEQD